MNQASSVTDKHTVEQKPHVPGEVGVWVFIFGDMCIFAVLFIIFLHYRSLDPELFTTARLQLNQTFGFINTLLLLSSSWLVVLGLRAARLQLKALARKFIVAAGLLGTGFGISKILEYNEKFAAGVTALTNDFFMFYFVLTGLHMFHVLIGLVVLAFLHARCGKDQLNNNDLQFIEGGGVFWHMVDLLWIILFPLVYLLA